MRKIRINEKLFENILFPILLLVFPLLKAGQGIDLTDTGYSLGNYRFFGAEGGIWTLLTFLSNVTGAILSKLPMEDLYRTFCERIGAFGISIF